MTPKVRALQQTALVTGADRGLGSALCAGLLERGWRVIAGQYMPGWPELGTLAAVHRPLVLLTSNNTRELSEALKRRCLYLFIGYPSLEQEQAVVRLKVPDLSPKLAEQAVTLVQRLRDMDLRKSPSISETLDWAKSLVALNAQALDSETLDNTMSVLLKHETDMQKVRRRIRIASGEVDLDDDELSQFRNW